MKKRIVSILIVLCLVLTLLPATAFAAVNTGNADNFISELRDLAHDGYTAISTPDELSNIRNNLSGKYYLTGNIDLSGKEWEPIGTRNQPFTGMLLGYGYTIQNLTISGRNGRSDFGLFGALGASASILDLGHSKLLCHR